MKIRISFGLLVCFIFTFSTVITGEDRFCEVRYKYDRPQYNAVLYDDSTHECLACDNETRVIIRSTVKYECCKGEIAAADSCFEEAEKESCNSTRNLCDGIKHCRDGRDEVGCQPCDTESFMCNDFRDGLQCIKKSHVCDGQKDCEQGKDETGCPWKGGQCDGYLCGDASRCLNQSQVCDGKKDCVDGSDEINCQYCVNQFRCEVFVRVDNSATSAQCIGKFRICNDISECRNGEDEKNCYRWDDWTEWSFCGSPRPCMQERRRYCLNINAEVVSIANCNGVYDKDGGTGRPNPDKDFRVCPECIISTTTTTTLAADLTTSSLQKANDSSQTTFYVTEVPTLARTSTQTANDVTTVSDSKLETTEDIEGEFFTSVGQITQNTEYETTGSGMEPTYDPFTTDSSSSSHTTDSLTSTHFNGNTPPTSTDTIKTHPNLTTSSSYKSETTEQVSILFDSTRETTSNSTVSSKPYELNWPFIIGMIVLAVLLIILFIVTCIACYIMKKNQTGFWRPPKRLPPPEKAHVPLWFDEAENQVTNGRPPISHPYPMTDDELEMQTKKNPYKLSINGNDHGAIDSGIEETNSTSSRESPRK